MIEYGKYQIGNPWAPCVVDGKDVLVYAPDHREPDPFKIVPEPIDISEWREKYFRRETNDE